MATLRSDRRAFYFNRRQKKKAKSLEERSEVRKQQAAERSLVLFQLKKLQLLYHFFRKPKQLVAAFPGFANFWGHFWSFLALLIGLFIIFSRRFKQIQVFLVLASGGLLDLRIL